MLRGIFSERQQTVSRYRMMAASVLAQLRQSFGETVRGQALAAAGVLVLAASPVQARPVEHAVFGGGCFWAMQSEFELLKGVQSAIPGYAGGTVANPSYEQVCSHTTGHAEVIDISYDPQVLSYKDLMRVFMRAHDPTTTASLRAGERETRRRSGSRGSLSIRSRMWR